MNSYFAKNIFMKLLFSAFLLFASYNLAFSQSETASAESVLAKASKQAKAENKKIFLIFHASWCGWCKKMDISMSNPACKKFFDDNFVIVHLTVEESEKNKQLENPGADLVKKKFLGEKAGLPFWLILDADQKLVADSYIRKPGTAADQPGDNIGCPASENEVNEFVKILKRTTKLNDEELAVIVKLFRQNESH